MVKHSPKIISIDFAVPKYAYTQREIFDEFGYPKYFWSLFKSAEIDKRHFSIPLEKIRKLSWQEQQEEYFKAALNLSKRAMLNCLDDRNPSDIAALVFSSCTGILPGPVMGHYLAREFKLASNTHITNIAFQGCDGGFPGLRNAFDFTSVTGKNSIVIACELTSCAYFPEPEGKPDPENHYELARSYAIFADACLAILVGFDNEPRHPSIIDMETYLNTEYLNELGFIWRDGRLRVRLSRKVPDIATELSEIVVGRLLKRHNLKVSDIKYWIIHPGGSLILDKIRDRLNLPEEKLKYSREALRLYGNCSSSTVGIIGKLLMLHEKPQPGDYGAIISLGPGMTADMTLLRWG